ncbi:hypothetical protein GGI20_005188 [Coemansia sp. BCRC 34301]|nr:hypothetical protein GGI20_005188 [Coemansia sp. BCRC 34301]
MFKTFKKVVAAVRRKGIFACRLFSLRAHSPSCASSPTPSSLCTRATSATAVCNTELSAVSDTEDTVLREVKNTAVNDDEDFAACNAEDTATCDAEDAATSDTKDFAVNDDENTTVSNDGSTTVSDNESAYSIASVVYDSDDCFSCYTFELDDCWSVLSTEYSYSDVYLCDSNGGDNDESDSISIVSCSSNVSVLSGEVHQDKDYFWSLSACERSTLDSALRALLLWDSGAKLLREQHNMLYRVILVAFNRRRLGELATPMSLPMAAAVNIMGLDAQYWVAPIIEKYSVKYLRKQTIELMFA